MAYHQKIPATQLALMLEIRRNHPILYASLHGQDLHTALANIAAYCDIVVDGHFTEAGVENLMQTLTNKLKDMSAIKIWTPH